MKLNDLRRLAIRRQSRIRFRLSNGMDCVINEHGIGKVPGLTEPCAFNLEDELARATDFLLEPAASAGREKPVGQSLLRDEMARLVEAPGKDAAGDHEE